MKLQNSGIKNPTAFPASFTSLKFTAEIDSCQPAKDELEKQKADLRNLRFRPGRAIERNRERIREAEKTLKQCRENPVAYNDDLTKTNNSFLGIRALWPSAYDYLFGK